MAMDRRVFNTFFSTISAVLLLLMLGCQSSDKELSSISVTPSSITLDTGESLNLSVTGLYVDQEEEEDITALLLDSGLWLSANESIATIDQGKVTAVGPGETYLMIKINTFSAKVNLIVSTNDAKTSLSSAQKADALAKRVVHKFLTAGATLKNKRYQHSSNVINGKLYVVGGSSENGTLNSLEIYDPKTDTWKAGAPLTTARNLHSANVLGGKLYVAGGRDAKGKALSSLEVYDPASDKWQSGEALKSARYMHSGSIIKGKLYLLGGANANGSLNSLEIYDPITGSWTVSTSLATARREHTSNVINGKLYVVGGYAATH